jgi:SAM-dependent methyltransferase
MKLKFKRTQAVLINNVINNVIPPFLRDSEWLMYPLFWIVFKNKTSIFLKFREKAYSLTDEEYVQIYKDTEAINLIKDSDLNQKCFEEIVDNIQGTSVLEVGCGRGKLLKVLSEKYKVTGCDIFKTQEIEDLNIDFHFSKCESLPFEDNSFDTVICTHVLEHVRDLNLSVNELKRVCRKKLIVVLPRERPYKFAFNLHLSFFPYHFSLISSLHTGKKIGIEKIEILDGDWYYSETFE